MVNQKLPDYKEIPIDKDNLAQYPSKGGNIEIQTFAWENEESRNKKDKDCKEKSEQKLENNPKKSHLKMMMRKCS